MVKRIKVMLVDDEPLFREFMRKAVAWEEYGFVICGEAENGIEALKKVDELLPDLILLDIRIPFMDGLTLAEKITIGHPRTKIVIVSGFDDFTFAKKALELGVENYLLKPFSEDELLTCLMKIRYKFEKEDEEQVVFDHGMLAFKEKVLWALLIGDIYNNHIINRKNCELSGIRSMDSDFRVLCVKLHDPRNPSMASEKRTYQLNAIANAMKTIIHDKIQNLVMITPDRNIVCLQEIEAGGTARLDTTQYDELFEMLCSTYQFEIRAGAGNVYRGIENINQSYIEAMTIVNHVQLTRNARVTDITLTDGNNGESGFYSDETAVTLLDNLAAGNREALMENLDSIFREFRQKDFSQEYFKLACTGLVSLCLSQSVSYGYNLDEVYGEGFALFSQIENYKTKEEQTVWVTQVFEKMLKYHRDRKSGTNKLVEKAVAYIEASYSDSDLSVESVAKHVSLCSNHMRNIFKKEKGMTVGDYILKVRMAKARELIMKEGLKTTVVAEMVGFNSVGYFGQAFKKYFGVLPSELQS